MSLYRLLLSVLLTFGIAVATSHADWLRFRGPNGSGISSESSPTPSKWSPTENVKWKAALPGPGVSSPIVVGDRVLVTCYSGYGVDRQDPGDIKDLKRHLICFDANTGETIAKSVWFQIVLFFWPFV